MDVCDGQDMVFHLAASVGGIGYNQENPATLFYDNAIMGVQLMEPLASEREEVRAGRDHLFVPQVHAGAVQGGEPVGRLSGGDERAVRTGEEDAAGAGSGISTAVRVQSIYCFP